MLLPNNYILYYYTFLDYNLFIYIYIIYICVKYVKKDKLSKLINKKTNIGLNTCAYLQLL